MLKHSQKTIDGVTFEVLQLPVEEAEALLIDLFKVFGPSLAAALGSASSLKQLLAQTVGSQGIVGAVRELADRLDAERYQAICTTLAGVTKVQAGKKWPMLREVQAELFRGKLTLKWQWLGFALGVQYGGFFDGLGNIGALVRQAVKDSLSSDSPAPSDGESGESSPTPE